MEPARYWHAEADGTVRCDLCPHRCGVHNGTRGRCRVRLAEGGQLLAWGYGRAASINLDPIEKKPLHHFHPGARVLSIGGWGCNLTCTFCQNWTISQRAPEDDTRITPAQLVAEARECGSIGIAYTYNEPLVGIEFIGDTARLTRAAGLVNVLVTNGFVNPAPAAELLPLIDAANIDLKSMDDAFYRRQCGGSLAPVQAFCVQAVGAGCHVEITNLVIPGLNDTDDHFRRLAEWVGARLGRGVPLHISAYRPEFQMRTPATPATTLARALRICKGGLDHVYSGNIATDGGSDTCCPGCGRTLIVRAGYQTRITGLSTGACANCGRPFDGVLGRT
jgi:pyruvate formate lyase activating enzyme